MTGPGSLARSGRALSLVAVLLVACNDTVAVPSSPLVSVAGPRVAVTIPPQGTAADLDIAAWNIEWFGDANNGPTNETLQLNNARDVILGTDADIWGVVEIVNLTSWNNLESQLPGYTGFIANESIVTGGSASYSSSEQKVGILYKSSMATLLGAKIILTANDYDFAGRPPLEVKLRVTHNSVTEDIVVIVLHMKAFNDESSRLRRQNASIALKNYLDSTYPTQKVFVIGDWNDDVDVSITPGAVTPFKNFNDDPARYTFVTRPLSNAGISSTTSYPDMIDHHLVTNEAAAIEIPGSVEVYRVDTYISNYDATTSDHFPVLSHYTWGSGGGGTPSVTVTAPNGGESWAGGSTQNITWTSSNIANVKLEYSLDNGSNYTVITSSTAASAGSYAWTVPSTASTTARVRITDAAGTTNDVSNNTFTITTGGGPANVIINEIMANEPGSSTAGEYVELVNVGGTSASIGGWTISDGSAVRHTFASGTSLAAGKAIVVFAGSSGIPAGTPNAIVASTGSLSLANGGDSVILKNGSTTVNSFTYTSSLANEDGVSMNRNPDATATGTFVKHNTISSLKSSPGRRVNGTDY